MPSLLFSLAGGRNLAPDCHGLLQTPREKEASRPLEPELKLFILLQFLFSCGASTGWQSHKCTLNPLLCQSYNRRFLKGRGARNWYGEASVMV